MSDDITFCYYRKCKNKKCMRHPINIRVHYIPHSFAYFTECEYWDMPMEYTAEADMKADVVKVVRCKDCKYGEQKDYAPPECRWYCKNSTNYHSGSFFCSLGERREDG